MWRSMQMRYGEYEYRVIPNVVQDGVWKPAKQLSVDTGRYLSPRIRMVENISE